MRRLRLRGHQHLDLTFMTLRGMMTSDACRVMPRITSSIGKATVPARRAAMRSSTRLRSPTFVRYLAEYGALPLKGFPILILEDTKRSNHYILTVHHGRSLNPSCLDTPVNNPLQEFEPAMDPDPNSEGGMSERGESEAPTIDPIVDPDQPLNRPPRRRRRRPDRLQPKAARPSAKPDPPGEPEQLDLWDEQLPDPEDEKPSRLSTSSSWNSLKGPTKSVKFRGELPQISRHGSTTRVTSMPSPNGRRELRFG